MCTALVGQQDALQFAVDELLSSCDCDEDQQMILQQFTDLKVKLACIKNAVDLKAAAYYMLLECSQSQATAAVTITRLHKRLKDDELTAEELCNVQSDLVRTKTDLMHLETHHLEMEALLTEAGITVTHQGTGEVLNIKDDVKKLLSEIESDEKKLKLCLRVLDLNLLLTEASNNLNEIDVVYLDDVDGFSTAVNVSLSYVLLCFAIFFIS